MSRRVEVVGGPWRERVRCYGWTVDDPGTGEYPFDHRMQNEVVIRLDNDPLLVHRTPGEFATEPGALSNGERWTCVIARKDLREA